MNAESTIDRLEAARRSNNVNWMDLVRLAFKVAPDEAKTIIGRICEKDTEIMDIAKELT